MNQKRLTTFGILLIFLLALVMVACGPAVPEGREAEYEAIMAGEDTDGEDNHETDEGDQGEEADSSEEDGDAAHGEEEPPDSEMAVMPPISERMPQELADDDYTESDTGLLYYDLEKGTGDSPEDGSIVDVFYAIWVMDEDTGEAFIVDDTFEFGQPFTFIVGGKQVFDGWEEGMLGMQVGGSRQLIIPPSLAFGEQGVPNVGIPANATLAMEIELIDVQAPPAAESLSDSDYEETENGVKVAVLAEGSGEDEVETGDTVTVEFSIWVADGERFFTGSDSSGQPLVFPIGSGAVFPGWEEGMLGMIVGEKRQLLIPSELALGSQGYGEIVPPDAELLMQVELVDLQKPRKATEIDEGDYETTDSGLKYYDLVEGDGEMPEEGQIVVVHYTGWLEDGTQFDSSLDRGVPFEFPLGTGSVIPGWDEGVATMKVGSTRQLVIPSDLAYGDAGAGGTIPPGATLIFEVELLELK